MPRSLSPSLRRLEANRLNATKSTGPRTEEGKARSRANAVKHGLTAESILLPGEDPVVVEELRDALWAEFDPATSLEEHLVDQLAGILMRLQRVPAFEAALFNWVRNRDIERERRGALAFDMALPSLNDVDETTGNTHEPPVGATIGALLDKDFLGKIMRYETSLQGRLRFTLGELYGLKARRVEEDGEQ